MACDNYWQALFDKINTMSDEEFEQLCNELDSERNLFVIEEDADTDAD
ncbi:MAG TPA: hypothetical protein PKA28_10730 [Methylomusa anaerophila]|uniref:Uncharacterized protein n=1 Tax=Methylomusa anaerophila TaxID=1930071 RepID=A0A348AIZ1_9FIRM|nr:hypothetical protein [Methylomusa anaerophila]BBB91039.1 hypothetical protein MAMMFC1_01707 [Methylomusa anaerophila]HML88909.1 hypothetical protein [Methylomusa anaerophila]